MARQEFLGNFRIARNLFFHPRVETDSSPIDPRAAEQVIARAAIWLTPKSVKGFSSDDFPELGLDKQNELRTAVGDFLNVASQVPPNEPATPEQYASARDSFARILRILAPYLSSPQEGENVEEALSTVTFPPWVVNWDYELGSDQDGSPAVWLNLYVDETTAPRKELGRMASQLTSEIHNALIAAGSHRWPYLRVRTALEHKMA